MEAVCTASATQVSCTSSATWDAVTAAGSTSFFTISGRKRLMSGTSFFQRSMPMRV